MLYSTLDKLLIVGGADFPQDLFEEVYDNGTPIIAADGGANFLADRNISPELIIGDLDRCLLYTSPSPRDATLSRMPSSA